LFFLFPEQNCLYLNAVFPPRHFLLLCFPSSSQLTHSKAFLSRSYCVQALF
jgi:hypothetical protein